MSRFKAVTVDKADFGGWVEVRDTRRGWCVCVLQDYKLAEHVAAELNNVRPKWFASTHEGNVFFDVRMGPYAGARMLSVKEAKEMGAAWAVGMTVNRLEIDMYVTLARYAARV